MSVRLGHVFQSLIYSRFPSENTIKYTRPETVWANVSPASNV